MSSNESWDIKVDAGVYRALKKFPRGDREAIIAILESMPRNPFMGDIEKMKGEEYSWRRRVGSYRIFYDLYVDVRIIHVTEVKRRTSSTY